MVYETLTGKELREIDVAAIPQMQQSTRIYDRNGQLMYELYDKRRIVVPLSSISGCAVEAVLSAEDRDFYHHGGFDIRGILRAIVADVHRGRIAQGGSTITQQLARNTFLTRQRSFRRKIQELWLAIKIERAYSKDQILDFYLNRVYFGTGYYGIEAASEGYFGKPGSRLTVGEAALLAGLIKGPSSYSPYNNPQAALQRRNAVLGAMADAGYITPAEAASGARRPLGVRPLREDRKDYNYAIDYLEQTMKRQFGRELTFNGGLKVYTTIDSRLQQIAEAKMERGLELVEKRPGFAGISRARYLKQLVQNAEPDAAGPDYLQGALLSMNAHTGEIYALVGGRNYGESKFNRAIDAHRQPGSAFKPFVYAAALESGMSPSSTIDASQATIVGPEGPYTAENSEGAQYGTVTLRTALAKSINTAAVQLGQRIGLARIIDAAHEFGIQEPLPEVASLPLGAGDVTLYEMVRAYSAFPNGGMITEPHIIERVEGSDGRLLFAAAPEHHAAVDAGIAFLLTSMMRDVVDDGTGTGVRAAGYTGPVAGKTGTTNDWFDAWFIGFTPDVVTGTWIGFDQPREIIPRGYGSTIAVPIWTDFMKSAFPASPGSDFVIPDSVVSVPICAASGEAANPACYFQLVSPGSGLSRNVNSDFFLKWNVPPQCHLHQFMLNIGQSTADLNLNPAGIAYPARKP